MTSPCCCGIFHRPVFFTALLSFAIFTYFGVQGPYTTGILTTLQREFKFKSSEIGFLLTVNDIVGLVIVTPLAYLGSKSHRPRIIGILTMIFAAGCFVSAIPQFVGGGDDVDGLKNDTNPLMIQKPGVYLCEDDDVGDVDKCSEAEEAASGAQYSRAIWLFLGQALCGIGGAGFFPLGITYIDDGVPKSSSSVHVAALFMMGSLSPVFAFSMSAFSLALHSDFYKIDVDELGYGDKDPRWIGAWWLGYIIYGCILLLTSILFFFFPKDWPHREGTGEELKEMNVPVDRENSSSPNVYMIKDMMPKEGTSIMELIKGYIKAMGRLLTNLTYITCLLAICGELAAVAGFFSFVGRYIQTQYDVTPAVTSIILGCVTSPAGFFGNLFGGLLVKKMKLSMKGLGAMAMSISGITLVLTVLYFFVGCDNQRIAGITVPYPGESEINLTPSCLGDCSCPSGVYTPVCGSDDLTYITPCHAGCSTYQEGIKYDGSEPSSSFLYSDCTCIGSNATFTSTVDEYEDFSVIQEACPRDCYGRLIAYIVIFGVTSLINSMVKNPSFMLKLRCVDLPDRAISMGLGSLIIRVLGFVPAPVYFGAAIQTTCLMFQSSCGKTGNCLIYDTDRLRNVLFGLLLLLKFSSVLCYFLSFITVRRDKSGEYHQYQLCSPSKRKPTAV
ncbi:solute carrier organic anion transporter family member 2A1-like [Lytechinus pictus]|uniref:solute carrier organic anion transporter family member 2A1-like n=1 Tax=Lytechinus pictus TaxID=7653 RepID=UPI0030B9F5C2